MRSVRLDIGFVSVVDGSQKKTGIRLTRGGNENLLLELNLSDKCSKAGTLASTAATDTKFSTGHKMV